MKTIGIIGAMDEEIENIKLDLDVISVKNIIGLDFFMGKMSGNNVILVRSGIGKVNASICSQLLIDLYGVDYIINIGVAGAINKDLEIGDVVISTDAMHHDFDTTVFGDALGIIPRMNDSIFTADDNLVQLALKISKQTVNSTVVCGRIVSGDKFISNIEDKTKIWNIFKASCVEMEGAGIAQTCFLNKIPFVIIRTISDKAEEGTPTNYNEFLKDSALTSSKIVSGMINDIE